MAQKTSAFQPMLHFCEKSVVSDGWMEGWMGGWMDGRAGLRIAYSNQKYPALVAQIVRELLFNQACNKNVETEMKGSRQLGSEFFFKVFDSSWFGFSQKQDWSWVFKFASLGDSYVR